MTKTVGISGADDLVQAIARVGDALWDGELDDHNHGVYVDINETPPEHTTPLTAPLVAIGYLVAYPAWLAERKLSRLLGRSYFCPLCHNPMEEALVYCPQCRRVQSRLFPTPGGVFRRTCPCGQGRWPVLGHLLRPPGPLVCRDTETFKGCYRPHRLPELAGRHRAAHVALLGTTVAAKHALMAHLFCGLVDPARASRVRFEPGWELSRLELHLCRGVLCHAFAQDTSRLERPGHTYSLARSFILKGSDGRLLVFHNLLNAWLDREELLARNSPSWDRLTGIIFVVDGERLAEETVTSSAPASELFTRVCRVIEKDCLLQPGRALPMRVAVALPFAAPGNLTRLLGGSQFLSSEVLRDLLMHREPALHGLLCRIVAQRRLRFWGGVLPEVPAASRSSWLQDMLGWVAGTR